jgi:hypothetical protein
MSVSDFILDYNSLQNKNVCVSGNIMSMGDIDSIMLSDRQNSMTSIFIDVTKLPRETKKQILQNCGIMQTCTNTVCGYPAQVMLNKGLSVNEIK